MADHRGATGAFTAITTLFFTWGFITSLVDPLVAAVKSIFTFSNFEAQLSAFSFFIAYGLVSIPAAMLVARWRATRSIVAALALMVAGCLVIPLAKDAVGYAGVLIGLFVLASGITILQVAANPLAAALGPPQHSHFRLTLSQAFNSLGTVLGPLLGTHLLLRGLDVRPGMVMTTEGRQTALDSIDTAFLLVSTLIVALGIFIWTMRRRIEGAVAAAEPTKIGAAFGAPWAIVGGCAIFLYVGAEVSIGTQMALFLHDRAVWNVPLVEAGYYVSLYWLGAMVGRFAGSALLIRVSAPRLLAAAAATAALLCLAVFSLGGVTAGYAALAVGLFNSIMFPTIFTITLERSTASDEATSGLLCVSIVGGAFVPLAVGAISDAHGYFASFLIPGACYAMLCIFALAAARTRVGKWSPPATTAILH